MILLPPGTTRPATVLPFPPPSRSITTTRAQGQAFWFAGVFSEVDGAAAQADAALVADAGLPSGVLRSDDHESLTPGFWVAYAGPYPGAGEAEAATQSLSDAGLEGSYARCVGTADQGPPPSSSNTGEGNGTNGHQGKGTGNGTEDTDNQPK